MFSGAPCVWIGMGLFHGREEEVRGRDLGGSLKPPPARVETSARLGQKMPVERCPAPVRGLCWALCRVGSSHQAGGGPRGGACCPGPPCPATPPHTYLSTSIFRPSTIVPFSFSRARSASELVSKVTNPKPCEQRRTDRRRQDEKRDGEVGKGAKGGREKGQVR